jgi:hypothetical protein
VVLALLRVRVLQLCGLLLFPVAARAADEPKLPDVMRLEYTHSAAKSCPAQEMLEDAVVVAAGRDPFKRDAAAFLRVTISRRGALYHADLEVRDGAGSVVFTHPFKPLRSCDSLVQDVGFVIGDRLRAPSPIPPSSPPPAPAPPKLEPPPAPRAAPLRLNLGIAGALALRTAAPVLGFNLAAGVGLRWRSFSGALEFRWTPPQEAAVDASGRAWGSAMQFTGGIVPCGHVRAFFACGLGQITAVVWQGAPGTMLQSLTLPAAAAGARLGGDVPLPWWGRLFALRLSADALVTLRHAAIYVDGSDGSPLVWTTPGLTVALGVGFVTDSAF